MSDDRYGFKLCFDADAPDDMAWSVEVSDPRGKPLVVSLGVASAEEAMEAGKAWVADYDPRSSSPTCSQGLERGK